MTKQNRKQIILSHNARKVKIKSEVGRLMVLFVVLTSVGFFTGAVLADIITVTNPSFESGTTG